MSDAVIVAIITGALSLLGAWVSSRKSTSDMFAKLDKQSELSDAKLDREIAVVKTEISALSQRVNVHNNMIERVYKLEGRMDEAAHEIAEMKKGA
jgi:HAMP domain-containing protein